MADFPALGQTPWREQLQEYIDEGDTPAPVIGHRGSWDPATQVYNGEALTSEPYATRRASLIRVRAGVGTPLVIAMVGDSTTAGLGSGQNGVKGWPEAFRAQLIAAGFPSNFNSMAVANRSTDGPAGSSSDSRLSVGAGWGVVAAGSPIAQNSTTPDPLTFTPEVAPTRLRVYADQTSGPFTILINGVARTGAAVAGTYDNATGLATPNGSAIFAVRFDTLPASPVISVSRVSGTTRIVGFDAPTPTNTGIRVLNLGLGGARSADLAVHNTLSHDAVAQRLGVALTFLNVGINDEKTNVTKAAYKANVQAEISRIGSFSTVVLLVPTPTTATAEKFQPYREALYELADENNLVLIDLYARYYSAAVATASSLMFDGTHPNAIMYEDIARAVIKGMGIL